MSIRKQLGWVVCLFVGISMVCGFAKGQATPSFGEFDRRAKEGQALSVVFFGGSLTWGANASDPQRTSYRALMGQYLQGKYPKAHIACTDAAIGGTGSKLGMFRLERDVLSHKPDLVFLDFTANDDLSGSDRETLNSYESLLRTMIGQGIAVEQVFLGFKYNFGPQWALDKLQRLVDHRTLAAAYHTGVGDCFPFVQERLTSGQVTREKLWPFDGAHPDDAGYELFFQAARDGFEKAVAEKRACVVPEKPVFDGVFQTRQRIRLATLPLPAGWKVGPTYRTSLWFDGLSSRWMEDVIFCDSKDKAAIQPITLQFNGSMIGLFGEADQDGLSFKASIDGKLVLYRQNSKTEPTEIWPCSTKRFGVGRLFVWRELADDLTPGAHTLVVEPVFPGDGEPHGQLRIESICVAVR